MTKKKERGSGHPWRDNIEAITMAVIMAVMLKYFIVEAYKIPTGSMQPTLMGNDETGIKDRILVDKFSYHFRKPERWEITVFKYPLDLSKNFIKRMVGVGPEELMIDNGDLWTRPLPVEGQEPAEWEILRRPKPVQREVWKPLYPGEEGLPGWNALGGARAWGVEEGTVTARGDGSLRYPPSGSVMDDYRHGYPLRVRQAIRTNRFSAQHPVGDLRLAGTLEALAGCTRVVLELREGTRRYQFVLPGPAAAADAALEVTAEDLVSSLGPPLAQWRNDAFPATWRLSAGDAVEFSAQNMDDRLTLEIDGEDVLWLDVPPATDQGSNLFLHVEGEGADFEDMMVYRDIYYIGESMKRSSWSIPEGHFVMLGDNTQDSSDAREWTLDRIRYPAETGEIFRGNHRGNNENPMVVPGMPGGAMEWFRDEYGELHNWRSADAERLSPVDVSVVPRDLITGRAVVVFWPFKPSFRLWRLQWVH
jgi:signal peptidase I